MMPDFQKSLADGAKTADCFISEPAARSFDLYYRELLQWNDRINLTAITGPEDAAIKHFLDSALVAKYVSLAGALVDIGSGAGFPGIPLKIMNPGLEVVLVETVRKKVSFLKQIIRLLKLEGIRVYHGRIESFDRPGAFDVAVSRAFAELGLFCRLAAPCIKPGGMLIAMKGGDPQELAQARTAPPGGFVCTAVHAYDLPRRKGGRSLVVLQKCFT